MQSSFSPEATFAFHTSLDCLYVVYFMCSFYTKELKEKISHFVCIFIVNGKDSDLFISCNLVHLACVDGLVQ